MAALAMQDGTARRSFLNIGANPDLFRAAVSAQYAEALDDVGIRVPEIASTKISSQSALYETTASGQALMKTLAETKKTDVATPLLSAHVLVAALAAQFGTTPRAFKHMGIDRDRLAAAAAAEITQFSPS